MTADSWTWSILYSETLISIHRYLVKSRLCGRVRVQSFIKKKDEGRVRDICSNAGWRLQDANGNKGNLCISNSPMRVFEVKSFKMNRNVCIVKKIKRLKQKVIVACDKIGNSCLPVHFEKNDNQKQSNNPCRSGA